MLSSVWILFSVCISLEISVNEIAKSGASGVRSWVMLSRWALRFAHSECR